MAAVEETVPVTIEQEVVSTPVTDVSPATEKTDGDIAGDGGKVAKKTKEAKPKKVSVKKARNPPAHPTYLEMITEAVTTLKEKNGSSQQAIQKFIGENHKNLPSNFRKLLLGNLRKLVASGKLVRIKNSFKFPAARSSPKPTAVKAKPAAAKPKKAAVKPKKAVTTSAVKPKKAVTSAVKPKKAGKSRTVAAAAAVTAKAKAKAKVVKPAAKAKVTAVAAKPKVAGTKRKAVEVVVKPKEKAAKVAKTVAKSTPSKKAAPVAKVAKVAKVVKAVAPKTVKPKSVKSVKSPAKRAMPRRGRK